MMYGKSKKVSAPRQPVPAEVGEGAVAASVPANCGKLSGIFAAR
jgi:hypothetical protein